MAMGHSMAFPRYSLSLLLSVFVPPAHTCTRVFFFANFMTLRDMYSLVLRAYDSRSILHKHGSFLALGQAYQPVQAVH